MPFRVLKWAERICLIATVPQIIIALFFLYGWLKCCLLGKEDMLLDSLAESLYFFITVALPIVIPYALLLAVTSTLIIITRARRKNMSFLSLTAFVFNFLYLVLLLLNAYWVWHSPVSFG